MLDTIIGNIHGNLTKPVCAALQAVASQVPNGGIILDLNCGEGRSTVVLASALNEQNRAGVVIAVDTHISDPFSQAAYSEGTILKFLGGLHRFGVSHRVIPMVCPVPVAASILGKRCANLIVIQSPVTKHSGYSEDGMSASMEIAKNALRKGGQILICSPNPVDTPSIDRLISLHFARGFDQAVLTPELYMLTGG